MNKSYRIGPILFLLLAGYVLASCNATISVQNAPTSTPNGTAAPTGTLDPLATPSADLTATPQVTGTPIEIDDDDFGNVTGVVGLVSIGDDGHITIYITLNGNGDFIVREGENSHPSGGSGTGHEGGDD